MGDERRTASGGWVSAGAASAAWTALWTLIVYPRTPGGSTPAGPIWGDADKYLAMVRGPISDVAAPYSFRIGAPLLARLPPFSPEVGLYAVTLLSLLVAGAVWVHAGRRLGLSRRSLLLAAVAVGSTQAWTGYFHNPYLTDGAGLLGVTLAWAAWMSDGFVWSLLLLAVGPLFRETMAPMALLWASDPRRTRVVASVLVACAPLIAVRLLPHQPRAESILAVMQGVLATKGPVRVLGDVLASYHALWLMALLGLRWGPAERRRVIGPPLLVTLLVATAENLMGVNTVRFFSMALPFVGLAVADFFEAVAGEERRLVRALAVVLAACSFVWFPTRPFGAWLSNAKVFQYLACDLALGLTAVAAWRWAVRRTKPGTLRPELASGGGAAIPSRREAPVNARAAAGDHRRGPSAGWPPEPPPPPQG